MKITITIVNGYTGTSCNIQTDNEQRISTTLRVLSDEIDGMAEIGNSEIIRIADTGRQFFSNQTYKELGIYSGTKIIV